MKFGAKKSRGGSEERANRRSRESAGAHFEKKQAQDRKDAMKKLRAAAKLAKQQVRDGCKYKRSMARLRAVEGRREVLMDVRDVLKQELSEIDTECAERMAAEAGPILKSIEELATEIRASVTSKRNARSRSAERPKASAAERRSEEYDRARRDVEAHDRRLVPVFERVKASLRPTDRQTLTEAFLELVAETPELLEQEQARAEAKIERLDLGCAEAIHEGKLGNEEAQAWAEANCGPKRRPKGSAASRTIGMFGPDLVPTPAAPATRDGAIVEEVTVPAARDDLPPIKWKAEMYHNGRKWQIDLFRNGIAWGTDLVPGDVENAIKQSGGPDRANAKQIAQKLIAPAMPKKPGRGRKAPTQQTISSGPLGGSVLDNPPF